MRAAIEWVVGEVLRTAPPGPNADAISPAGVQLLLRHYAATGRDDCRQEAERSLAQALHLQADSPEWLETFAEAAALSADPRLHEAIARGVEGQRRQWPAGGAVDRAARSLEVCLAVAPAVGMQAAAVEAIDELERLVGAGYRPGHGIAPASGQPRLIDQVATASALLTAFTISARLPYAMLAEELVQFSQRTFPPDNFVVSCAFARLLCRFAALHADPDYQRAAVIAPQADYRGDALTILQRLEPECRHAGGAAAEFALAAGEYLREQI